MANLTFKDIQDNAMALLSKTDDRTRGRVKNWINLGQTDFVMREVWPFREATVDFTTTAETQEYSLADEVTADADAGVIDAGNILSVVVQGAPGNKLKYKPFPELRRLYADITFPVGVPEFYYIRNGNIGFYPTPAAATAVQIDYYITPVDLDLDDDESIIPLGYREALVHYAVSLEHDINSDPDLAVKASNRYEQIVQLARVNLLAQPMDSAGFTIRGASDSSWTNIGV